MSNMEAHFRPIALHDEPASKDGSGGRPHLRLPVVLAIALLTGCGGKSPTELLGQGTQQLRPAPERAFAWANHDEVNLGTYAPDPGCSFNPGSSVGPNITNTAPGLYSVQFPGLNAQAGNYQVAAYGGAPGHRCQLKSWLSDTANVMCVERSGALVNSKFVISYTNDFKNQVDSQGHLTPAGFLFADHPDTPSYNPNPAFSYNSSGQLNTILPDELTHVGLGRYVAVLSGLNTDQGNAQVTAVGDQPAYCKLNGWVVFPGTADLWVGILCFDATGAPKNNAFSLQFVSQPGALSDLYDRAYVWADQPLAPFGWVYSPNLFYNYDRPDQSSGNVAEHVATGQYLVGYPHIPMRPQTTAMVSALGDDPNYCNPVSWSDSPDGTTLGVDCFDQFGNPADESFSAMYLHQESSCGLPDPFVNEGVPATWCNVSEHLVHPGQLQKRDNPVLRGYADTSGLTSWQPGLPMSIDETYAGSSVPMIATNPPSILGEFAPASTPSFNISGVTATTYSRTLEANATPWIPFTDTNDGTHAIVRPPSGWTLPYWTAGLALPKNHGSVTVQMFDARGTSSSNTLVNEFQVQLDSSVLVVPVYVHILRDKNGNPPTANPTANPPVHTYDATFTIGTLPTQVNPTKDEQIAWNMGQLFDPTTVRYPYWPIVLRSTFAEGVPEKILDPSAKRTDTLSGSNGGTVEVPTIADDIFGQCEQFPPFRPVQLRLMGVSFIRQGLGLEKLLLPASTAPSSCQFVGDPPLCGIGGTPAGTLGQQIVATYDAAAPGVPRGIHVIVGGAIFPVGGPVMMNCGGPTSGFSCMHSRFALIDGSGSGNSDGRFYVQTIFHEIGHLLTLNGNHDDGDPHNLMASHADRDNGLLTASQCAQIVNQAGRY